MKTKPALNHRIFHKLYEVCVRLLFVVALVALAAALRIWPLQELELRAPWITFYPAVMVIAVYNGVWIGFLTTILSALTVYFWSPIDKPFIVDYGDWLGMFVFLVNCSIISLIAEGMIRARKRAKEAQERAEMANKAKSVFLSTMSHELRTPLNAILGFSNLMRSDANITAEQRENLDIINRSGEHLLTLINDILDMSKIEAGRIVLENKPFDICTMARNIVDMLEGRANEKGLQLALELYPQFPCFIIADADKLQQIIINLIGNAIKFTAEGGVVLRLDAQTTAKALNLIIEVEDSGIGMSETDQLHVFEPFVQVGKSATQKGTGLGLAIVKEYVELMGGHIEVKSVLHKGSIFRMLIPVQKADESEECQLPEILNEHVTRLESGQGEYRILIVEDQLENQLLLKKLLLDAGFIVKIAENGLVGVEMFQSFQPHLIWMDRRMPEMDGLEATQRIRQLPNGDNVKIVALTASVFSDQRDEMLDAGMDDFIRKPYRPSELFDCMARLLGVRFVHEKVLPEERIGLLTAETFATLPESLRQEMATCLNLGDTERFAELIDKIEQQNLNLAKILAHHLDNFNYLPILKALEQTK